MPDLPDLTSTTVLIVLATAIIVPQLRLRDARKRLILRCVVICLAAIVYLIITVPHLRTYPPTANDTVYVTKTGEKYHTADCSHLRKSKIPIIMADAVAEGYDDCSDCAPPLYRTKELRITLRDLYPKDSRIMLWALPLAVALFYGIPFLCIFVSEQSKGRSKTAKSTLPQANTSFECNQQHSPPAAKYVYSLEQVLCESIWKEVSSFRSRTDMAPDIIADTYLWTALSFVAAAQVHNQEIIDNISLRFGSSAYIELQNFAVPCGTPLIREMHEVHEKTEKILYHSNINPHTDDGIRRLWVVIRGLASANNCTIPNDPAAFNDSIVNIRDLVNQQKEKASTGPNQK